MLRNVVKRQSLRSFVRFNSSVVKPVVTAESSSTPENNVAEEHGNVEAPEGAASHTPWYIRTEEPAAAIHHEPLPEFPAGSPASLETLSNYLIKDLGLSDLKIFDMRASEVDGDFMLLSTGKSPKHVQKAGELLTTYIKSQGVQPYMEGLIKGYGLARIQKKLRKMKNMENASNDFGVGLNTWIMCDSKMDNIYVHILTKERRDDLNLELLWAPPSEKHLYKREAKMTDDDNLLAGLLQRRYYSAGSSLQQALRLGDLEFVNTEVTANLYKQNPEISRIVAAGLVDFIKQKNAEDMAGFVKKPEFRQFMTLFEKNFPIKAEPADWDLRFQLLNMLKKYGAATWNDLITNYQAQMASGIVFTEQQLQLLLLQLLQHDRKQNKMDIIGKAVVLCENIDEPITWQLMLQNFVTVNDNFITPNNTNVTPEKFDVSVDLESLASLLPDSSSLMVTALLINNRNWARLLKYWNSIETRPWLEFFNMVHATQDKKFIMAVVNEQIPAMLRDGIQLDEPLTTAIRKLLDEVDPDGKHHARELC